MAFGAVGEMGRFVAVLPLARNLNLLIGSIHATNVVSHPLDMEVAGTIEDIAVIDRADRSKVKGSRVKTIINPHQTLQRLFTVSATLVCYE